MLARFLKTLLTIAIFCTHPAIDAKRSSQLGAKPFSVQGERIIVEKACTGPFKVRMKMPSTAFMSFWLELKGAEPGWTSFYSDAGCRKRLQSYRGSARDGGHPKVSKARLDFEPGVVEQEFFVRSKSIKHRAPTVVVRLTGLPVSNKRWTRYLSLRRSNDGPMASVAQQSMARAAVLGPDVSVNELTPDNPTRFDLSLAKLWHNQLIVHSQATRQQPSRLTMIDLESQAIRRLRKHNAPAAVSQRVTGNYVLLQVKNPTRIEVVNLESGRTKTSGPISAKVVDFAVAQGQLVVVTSTRSKKRTVAKKKHVSYAVQYYALDTLRLKQTVAHKRRPVVSAAGVHSLSVKTTKHRRLKVQVFKYNQRGKATGVFSGEWPAVAKKCRRHPFNKALSSERYYVVIDRCGTARALDFKQLKVFDIATNLVRHFKKPTYQLTRDLLIVKGSLINANRGAGDGGANMYVFSLSDRKWIGRLNIGNSTRPIADSAGNDIALVSANRCPNPFNSGSEAGFIAQAPSSVRHLRLLDNAAIGKRGASLARAYGKRQREQAIRQFERFGKDAGKLFKLQASAHRPSKRRAPRVTNAIGTLNLGNSRAFKQYLYGKQKLKYAQATRADYACESIAIRTYDQPDRAPTGWLSAVIRPANGDFTQVDGWLADLKRQKFQPLPLHFERDSNPSLPVYERTRSGWVRLSPKGKPPVWVKEADMGIAMRSSG